MCLLTSSTKQMAKSYNVILCKYSPLLDFPVFFILTPGTEMDLHNKSTHTKKAHNIQMKRKIKLK